MRRTDSGWVVAVCQWLPGARCRPLHALDMRAHDKSVDISTHAVWARGSLGEAPEFRFLKDCRDSGAKLVDIACFYLPQNETLTTSADLNFFGDLRMPGHTVSVSMSMEIGVGPAGRQEDGRQ